jgi:hypothetical protein
LLVVALRDLLRAAEFVLELTGDPPDPKVKRAVSEFFDQVPDVLKARNVLEHFDDYFMGKGRDKGALQCELGVIGNAEGCVLLEVKPYKLDVDRAERAATQLMERLGGMTPEVRSLFEGH